ncbi:GAF domain-containing protein [Candidatus Bipolaricaulota bacterium]|nr:GAF domain-containing protein [Candidatus Bipolaricaulota bacterium]
MTEPASCDCLSGALRLIDAIQAAQDMHQCCQSLLEQALALTTSQSGFVLVSDPRLPSEHFLSSGFEPNFEARSLADRLEWLDQLADAPEERPTRVRFGEHALALQPIRASGRVLGMIGLAGVDEVDTGLQQLMPVIGTMIERLAAKTSMERKLLHFDTFLEVSSLLAKPVGLSESLDIALFSSMKAVSAEAASILLLDEAKQRFRFFHVEGAAKPLLGEITFDSSEGVAGRVLQSLEAQVVNDVVDDVQFYGQIDSKTGFRTRNLIAVPLLAGNDPIGVLEVLNRSGNEDFTVDDRLLLVAVADQIAYAIRNAQLFDQVVQAYCKRRQGEDSCDKCPQPLESWDPCNQYRER